MLIVLKLIVLKLIVLKLIVLKLIVLKLINFLQQIYHTYHSRHKMLPLIGAAIVLVLILLYVKYKTPADVPGTVVATVDPATGVVTPVTTAPDGTCVGVDGKYAFLGTDGSVPMNTTFANCQGLKSSNGKYIMVQQSDGKLVIYNLDTKKAIWTNDAPVANLPNRTTYQTDSNFVTYDANNKPLWSSNRYGYPTNNLILQTDGNLVIYKGAGSVGPVWATGVYNV